MKATVKAYQCVENCEVYLYLEREDGHVMDAIHFSGLRALLGWNPKIGDTIDINFEVTPGPGQIFQKWRGISPTGEKQNSCVFLPDGWTRGCWTPEEEVVGRRL